MSAPARVRVFLSGEGANELGSRAGHRAYQTDERPGVLHALLARIQPDGWEVGGATAWAKIRKYRVQGAAHADTGNVLGVAVDAIEAGCQIVAFSRDVDDDPDRARAVEDGIARVATELDAGRPDIIGGVAVPSTEGWILALRGQHGTQRLSTGRAVRALVDQGVEAKDGARMAEIAAEADLDAIPADAESLRTWIQRARDVLPRRVLAPFER